MRQDLIHALLLPLPPLLGFWIFRRKGRVGLSYGYFLGGIVAVLSLPWPEVGDYRLPSAFMGGALFGFSLYLQAHREGPQGLRRLGFGVGGSTVFAALLGLQMGLTLHSFVVFWAWSILGALLWLLLSDLSYRLTRGRYLHLRMPLVGGSAMLLASLLHHYLPYHTTAMAWWASLLSGLLLGLVVLQQLLWLRAQGIWVEGRGDGFRMALALVEKQAAPEGVSLSYGIESAQPMLLLNEKGEVLESNGAFSRLVGLPRHQLRGFDLAGIFQGQNQNVWETLREELQRQGRGVSSATLVRQDGSFEDVSLEATAFDRNMALVWVADPAEGTLALRGSLGILSESLDSRSNRRDLVNALGTIQPAAEQILLETQEEPTRRAAELILVAASRLRPEAAGGEAPALDAAEAMMAQASRLQRMMPPGIRVDLRAAPLELRVRPEAFQRILTHLALHGRQAIRKGTVILGLELQVLGGRRWALLSVEIEGDPGPRVENMLGLGWLQEQVGSSRGMLELSQDPGGSLWPFIYLPMAEETPAAPVSPLLAKRVWIMDQDPMVQEALCELVKRAGGEPLSFWHLRDVLKASRDLDLPHLLVLERSPSLERFHRAIRSFQREPIPTLVIGDGSALPVPPLGMGLRRVGFLQKPFSGQEFIQSLLALLQAAHK